MTISRALALTALAALFAGCGGSSKSSMPVTASSAAPPSGDRATMTIVIARSAPASSVTRRPALVPTSTAAVDARITIPAAGTAPVSTSCVNFPAGAPSVTLSILAPVGTNTLTVGAYDGACTAAAQGGTATGTLLASFAGTGTVALTSTDANAVYNAGAPIVLSKSLPAYADVIPAVSWTEIGPVGSFGDSGKLQSFVRNPLNTNQLWTAGGLGTGWEVGSQAGIFRSVDGGTSWQKADNGLADTTVNALWISSDGATLLAATQFLGVYRSTDGGSNWSRTLNTSSTCVVSTSDAAVYACGSEGIYRSGDRGSTWALDVATTSPINTMAVAGARVFAGTLDSRVLSLSNGAWSVTGTVVPKGYGVHALAFDAVHNVLFASMNANITNALCPIGCASQVLSGSPDGGVTWSALTLPVSARGAQTLAVSALTPGTIYVGDAGHLFRTTDGGQTFGTSFSPGDSRGDFVFPSADGTRDHIVDASDQGLYEITQYAVSSRPLAPNLKNFVIYDVAASASTVVTAVQDYSPFVTTDDGTLWTAAQGPGFYEDGAAWIDPASPAHCYLWDQGGFHRSADGAHTWTLGSGIPSSGWYAIDSIATDGSHPGTVYVATAAAVMRSTDYGATFTATGWPFAAPLGVYVSADGKTIVVSNSDTSSSSAVYASHDGGASFRKSNFPSGPYSVPVLAISPADSDIVVAATYSSAAGVAQIYRSTDGGFTYAPLGATGLVPSSLRNRRFPARIRRSGEEGAARFPWSDAFSAAAFASAVPEHIRFNTSGAPPYLALATHNGIYLSSDYGSHWHNISANAIVRAFYGVAWTNGRLVVTTAGEGALRSGRLQ